MCRTLQAHVIYHPVYYRVITQSGCTTVALMNIAKGLKLNFNAGLLNTVYFLKTILVIRQTHTSSLNKALPCRCHLSTADQPNQMKHQIFCGFILHECPGSESKLKRKNLPKKYIAMITVDSWHSELVPFLYSIMTEFFTSRIWISYCFTFLQIQHLMCLLL